MLYGAWRISVQYSTAKGVVGEGKRRKTYKDFLRIADAPRKVAHRAVGLDDLGREFDAEPGLVSTSPLLRTKNSHLMHREHDPARKLPVPLDQAAKRLIRGTRRNLRVPIKTVLYDGQQRALH
jgi:hypothetical protein